VVALAGFAGAAHANGPDYDGDGVEDQFDNCSEHANPAQDDTDADGCGNLCDPDYDNSGTVGFGDWGQFVAAWGTNDEEKVHTEPVPGGIVGYRDHGFFVGWAFGAPGPC
jgi:hypothetical protein